MFSGASFSPTVQKRDEVCNISELDGDQNYKVYDVKENKIVWDSSKLSYFLLRTTLWERLYIRTSFFITTSLFRFVFYFVYKFVNLKIFN